MKIFIFATAIVLAIADVNYHVREDIAEQWEELTAPIKHQCIEESGVNEEDVRDLFKRGHFPDNSEFKCYLKCLGVKLTMFSQDGTFNEVTIRSIIKAADLDIIEDSIKFAENVKDFCERSYLYVTTAVSKVGERYPPHNHFV